MHFHGKQVTTQLRLPRLHPVSTTNTLVEVATQLLLLPHQVSLLIVSVWADTSCMHVHAACHCPAEAEGQQGHHRINFCVNFADAQRYHKIVDIIDGGSKRLQGNLCTLRTSCKRYPG